MSSILPGFEYDIFISYRHNDNRSGWATEFVKAIQEELAATIKGTAGGHDPAMANATACTYEAKGRQYVALSVGGTTENPSGFIMAFALPD